MGTKASGDHPAFPSVRVAEAIVSTTARHDGATKRELFGALILQGLCASAACAGADPHVIAQKAVVQVDAYLAALKKGGAK